MCCKKAKNTKRLQNLEMMRNASKKELAIAQEQWEEDKKTIELKLQRQRCRCSFNDDWNSRERIAQTESNKLAILPELIESKVIGQKKLF
jgi:ATP-dependent Clp protease ATP-binding subunit ClpC